MRGKIPDKWFVTISTEYAVNLEWLVSGTGQRDVAQPVQSGVCQQCAELQKQLAVANERLYQANEEVKVLFKENGDLKETIGKLNAELAELKNKLSTTANDCGAIASVS